MFKKMNLFNKTNMKILEFLSESPLKSFYEKEISKTCKLSTGAVNNHMKLLKHMNLITFEKKGKTSLYKINLNNLISRQIKYMFNVVRLFDLIEEIKPLSKKIILFGSYAEGMDTEKSDIDLFILSAEKSKILNITNKFKNLIGKKISPIIADQQKLNKIKDTPVYKNILRGKVLWDKNESSI